MPVVFTYGCLMDALVMGRVCPTAEPWSGSADASRSAGRLAGHRLAFPIGTDGEWGAAVAGVVPDGSTAVEGGLWRVDASGLALLDAYEEVELGVYERVACSIEVLRPREGGAVVEAWVYRATLPSADAATHRPGEAYRAAMLSGADFFGLSAAYRSSLAAIHVAGEARE